MKQTHYGTFLTSRYVELPYLDLLYVTLMIHMCFLIIWKKRKPKIITNKYYRLFFLMKKLMLHRKTDDRPQNDHCILSLFFFAETRKLDTTKHNCSTSYRYFDANVMSLDFFPNTFWFMNVHVPYRAPVLQWKVSWLWRSGAHCDWRLWKSRSFRRGRVGEEGGIGRDTHYY